MTDDEYEIHIDKVIIALTQQDIRSADGLAAQMQPGHAANKKVFEALRTVMPCTLSARNPDSSQKYTSPPEAFASLAMAGYRSCRHASIASGSRW